MAETEFANSIDDRRRDTIKALKSHYLGIANPINLFRRIWLDLSGYEAFAH